MLKRFANWTAEFAKEAHLLYTCASIVSNTIPVGGGAEYIVVHHNPEAYCNT